MKPGRIAGRALVALVAATLMPPLYLAAEYARVLPIALRDRPWPFLFAIVLLLALALRNVAPRVRVVLAFYALALVGALGGVAHQRYRLPPASATQLVGRPLPDVTLPDESGNRIRLHDTIGKPILLIWFRGSWCPYCRRQLVDLAAVIHDYAPLPFAVFGVTADPPEPLAKLKRELNLPFPILSDPERRLVGICELNHCVALTDAKGVVTWAVLSGNWQTDLPARALLQAAYRSAYRAR